MVSDIALFFEPISEQIGALGLSIRSFSSDAGFPMITKGTVAIVGVPERRGDNTAHDCKDPTSSIRASLYRLKNHFSGLNIVDLGNIRPGETLQDTYYALSVTVSEIVKQGGIAVIIGGSQDLTHANYLAYEKLEQVVNLVCVDARFDLGDANDALSDDRFLQKIILHQPNILFNYSNLGYQSHHVQPKEIDLMKKMYFDVYRLGEVHNAIEEVEPVVRSADILSMDLNAIRSSDFPANLLAEPNGLYGEEACAIARYGGLSDKLTSFGLYNVNDDQNGQSSGLVAQVIWYFLWGVSNRKKDYPIADKSEYTKYTVTLANGQYDVIFYKSSRSDRWWMEVPYPTKRGAKYERHFMVPCSYDDYKRACEDEIPDRWWQTFQKLS